MQSMKLKKAIRNTANTVIASPPTGCDDREVEVQDDGILLVSDLPNEVSGELEVIQKVVGDKEKNSNVKLPLYPVSKKNEKPIYSKNEVNKSILLQNPGPNWTGMEQLRQAS